MNETEDTCRHCAHYRPNSRDYAGRGKGRIGAAGMGVCTCWHVKGKNGNYLGVKSSQTACDHYMPSAVTVNSME